MRHFQTPCSAAGLYCSACQTPLTDAGKAMAQALAAGRAGNTWRAIYASTMPRAQASAAPLAAACHLPVHIIEGVQELNYGEWEGSTRADARARDPEFFAQWEARPGSVAPPGGETSQQVAERALGAIAELSKKHTDEAILVVSHKATIRIALCALLGIDVHLYRARLAQPLGGISIVDFRPEGPQLRSLGDVQYLPANLQGMD